MTHIPPDMGEEQFEQFIDDHYDTQIRWSTPDGVAAFSTDQVGIQGRLLSLDYKPDVSDEIGRSANYVVDIRVPAPIGYGISDPDIRERLADVAEALADGRTVTVEGEQ